MWKFMYKKCDVDDDDDDIDDGQVEIPWDYSMNVTTYKLSILSGIISASFSNTQSYH